MVRPGIKTTFINSTIFETPEDMESNPFEFMEDNLQKRCPADIPNQLYQGFLLRRILVSQLSTKAVPSPKPS